MARVKAPHSLFLILGLGNSFESYRTQTNWPCRRLLLAILRKGPGHPKITEAVSQMLVLAKDFATYQEIYLRSGSSNKADFRRGTEGLIPHELNMTCFSPTKAMFEPSLRGTEV